MPNCCKYVRVREMKPMCILQVLRIYADSQFIYKNCWKPTSTWFFLFLNLKNWKREPNFHTRGKVRMPAYEKCENEEFRLCSCGKILAMVSHHPYLLWHEIQWHTWKSSWYFYLYALEINKYEMQEQSLLVLETPKEELGCLPKNLLIFWCAD